jgi:hypothetical protein
MNKTYRVFGNNLSGGTCKGCGKAIVWAETLNGKQMPIDGTVNDLTPVASIHEDGRIVFLLDATINPSHFGTCPQAKSFRRGR